MKLATLIFSTFIITVTACGTRPQTIPESKYDIDRSQLVVKFDQGLSESEIADHLDKLEATQVEWLSSPQARQGGLAVVSVPEERYHTLVESLEEDSKLTVLPVRIYENQQPETMTVESQSAPDHISQIQADAAWNISQGEGVVVAVTDDGFDFDHEDLKDSFWQNQGEIGTGPEGEDLSSNGVDDDGNGYVDDFRGWDMGRDDNNPKPEYSFHHHGTFVTGIIAANKDNNTGTIGVAPKSKILPLKYRVGTRWTSVDILRGYKYAADQGARIINTSYDLDLYADDPVFLEALDYVYNKGVLVVNSAGNTKAQDSARQNLDKMLVICGLGSQLGPESISDSSNFGHGIDLCAPSAAYSSTPNNRYNSLSGTSFSAAMVSAGAALIWSKHPRYSLDQVVATLVGTADSVDHANEGYAGMLGSGRMNAYRAVTERPTSPSLRAITIDEAEGKTLIRLKLRGVLSPKKLRSLTPIVRNSRGVALCGLKFRPYYVGANELVIESTETIPAGRYKVDLTRVRDPFGQGLARESPNGSAVFPFILQ